MPTILGDRKLSNMKFIMNMTTRVSTPAIMLFPVVSMAMVTAVIIMSISPT